MHVIAVFIGIGLQLLLYLVYIFNSLRFIGSPSEKLQYYVTANVPFVTVVIYGVAIFQYNTAVPEHPFLNYFFIEWMITTPMLIANTGRILHIRLYKYFLLSAATIGMSFSGYVAHNLENRTAALAIVGAGGLCCCFVISFLAYIYYRRKRVANSGKDGCVRAQDAPFTLSIAKKIITTMSVIWSFYPIVFICKLCDALTLDEIITIFIALDFLSKGVFTSLILGYYDQMNRRNSFLKFLMQPVRIFPVQTVPAALPVAASPSSGDIIDIVVTTPQQSPRLQKIMVHSAPIVFEDM